MGEARRGIRLEGHEHRPFQGGARQRVHGRHRAEELRRQRGIWGKAAIGRRRWERALARHSRTAYTCGKDQAFRCATFEAREQELDVADVVCLPLSVWSRVTVSGDDVLVESGWLHAPNKKKTVLRDYHDAVLQRVELTDWTRDSAV